MLVLKNILKIVVERRLFSYLATAASPVAAAAWSGVHESWSGCRRKGGDSERKQLTEYFLRGGGGVLELRRSAEI